jgi:hypothetical protein
VYLDLPSKNCRPFSPHARLAIAPWYALMTRIPL